MIGASTSMKNSDDGPIGNLSMKDGWRGAMVGNTGFADFPTSALLQRRTCAPIMN